MKKFLIILFSPALLFLFYDVLFYWLWVPFGEYSDGVIYSLSIFTIINLFLLIWVVFSVRKIATQEVLVASNYQNGSNILIVSTLIFIGVAALYMQLGGELSLDFEERYSEVAAGGIFYIVIMQIVAYILIYDLYIGRQKPFVFFLVFMFVALSALTGGRSGVIWLSLFIFFIAATRFNLGWSYMTVFLTFVGIFFVGASILRGTITFGEDNGVVGFLDFNQIFTLEETMRYTERYGAQFIRFFGDVADGFLPRSINTDKNTSTAFTREVFPHVWEKTSYTSGFYANLVFVFGHSGLFVAPLFMVIINGLYLRAIVGVSRLNFIKLFFCFFPLLIVRGGIFEFRVVFALFLLLLAILLGCLLNKKIVF